MKVDAFISHASANSEFAELVDRALTAGKLKTWVDRANVGFGGLLRNQIQSAIRDSRVLVLLWSEAAFASRWVMAEIFTAFYLERFIIPCVLDATPLPQFLSNTAYLDHQRDKDRIGQELCRAVRTAPNGANDIAAVLVSETSAVQSLIHGVAAGQYGVLGVIVDDREKAAKANRHVSNALHSLQEMAPLHPMVLNLAGYQCKNEYLIKHWDAIQAGRAPEDPLLQRSERHFFESLCVNPFDESAVNGLGSILFLSASSTRQSFSSVVPSTSVSSVRARATKRRSTTWTWFFGSRANRLRRPRVRPRVKAPRASPGPNPKNSQGTRT